MDPCLLVLHAVMRDSTEKYDISLMCDRLFYGGKLICEDAQLSHHLMLSALIIVALVLDSVSG